jgi:hypothetical protein
MTEQQRPDEEVEGHGFRWGQDTEATKEDQVADDTQGHIRFQETEKEASGEDVEGHARIRLEDQASEGDVEGHRYRWGQDAEAVDEEEVSDDVGGHQMPRRPL